MEPDDEANHDEARRHEALTLAIANAKGLPMVNLIEDARLIVAYLKGADQTGMDPTTDSQSMN